MGSCVCRYNELILAGTSLPAAPVLAQVPAYLAAQNDTVTNRFAEANAAGLAVFRVFAAGGDFSGFVLQPGPGERCDCCLG